jgi:hypothetical protein
MGKAPLIAYRSPERHARLAQLTCAHIVTMRHCCQPEGCHRERKGALITSLLKNQYSLFEQRACDGVITLVVRQEPGGVQRVRPRRRT